MSHNHLLKLGLLTIDTTLKHYKNTFYSLIAHKGTYEYKKYQISLVTAFSKMFTTQITSFTIAPELQTKVIPFMDKLDQSVTNQVDIVINNGGVIIGYYSGTENIRELLNYQLFILPFSIVFLYPLDNYY